MLRSVPSPAPIASRLLLASLILLLPIATPAASPPAKPPPPETPARVHSFTLSDQFGVEHQVVFPRSQPLVLLVGDRKGSEEIDDWISLLKSSDWQARFDVEGVADLKGIPRLFHSRLSDSLRKSRNRPVLLDFEGTVTGPLGCKRKTANLLVIDPTGHVRLHLTGPADPTHVEAVGAAIKTAQRAVDAPPKP